MKQFGFIQHHFQCFTSKIHTLSNYFSGRKNGAGFTLIELLWSIAIASILSSVGIAAFFTYSRTQALNAAVSEFTTTLQLAKFRAQSQVKPTDGACTTTASSPSLLCGYKVVIDKTSNPNTYQLAAICTNNTTCSSTGNNDKLIGEPKPLPNGINFSCIFPSTASWVSFQVLTGQANNNIDNEQTIIELSGYDGKTKTVSVSESGVIQLSGTCVRPQ